MDYLLISLIFDILRYAVSSIFLGLLFTIISVGALFMIIKSLYSKYTLTPLSFIIGAILFVLLFFQLVFVCGAFKVKGMADDIETSINRFIPKDQGFTLENSQITEHLKKEYPLLDCYVDSVDFQKLKVSNIADYLTEMQSVLNMYIWRRIGWSLGFMLLGTFIIIKTMEAYRTATTRSQNRTAIRSNGRGRGFR